MHRWTLAVLVFLAYASAQAQEIDYKCLDPMVETRAMWVDAGAIPKTPEGIRDLMASYRRAHINLIFPEVIARGYTVYPSKLLARDPRFTGAPDVLAIMIREAHAVGIEVHPWVWVFRAGYTKDKGAILSAHPDWAELSRDGDELSPNGGYWISPVIPQARDFLADLYAEMLANYDVDGIHLDYIRYETEEAASYGYAPLSRELFRKQYGIDPLDIGKLSFHQYEWEKFRERQINTFVQRIALLTRFLRPGAMVSAAVGANPKTARLDLMQNWPNWAANKWVDFVVPMSYSTDDPYFVSLLTAEKDAVDCFTLLIPGIGFFTQKDPGQMVDQIGIARDMHTSGQALFSASYFRQPQAEALVSGPYAKPADQPFREPWVKSRVLCERAVQLRNQGADARAAYYAAQADVLAGYAKYLEADIGYVPPTPPPLDIPEYVVPIPSAEVPSAQGRVRIDGKLDEPAWRTASAVRLSYTNTGAPAPVATTAYLAHDATNLYIAFECTEPEQAKIRADVGMRDGPVFQDDSVEVFIDPTGRGKDYYHLATNTIETRFDQKVTNPAWNGDWKTASKATGTGWTTEIAIPFSTLEVARPAAGAAWGINLTRNRTVTGSAEHLTWSVPYGSFHTPERFGRIVFR